MTVLRLVVQTATKASEVEIECEPATPVREVLAELAGYLELRDADLLSARVERTGHRLSGDTAIADAGLRDGDRIRLAEDEESRAAAAEDAALVELVVVGGPDAGRRVGLAPGRHVVGRGPGADVVLKDRSLSRRHLSVDVADGALTIEDVGSSNGTFVEGGAISGERQLQEDEVVEAGRSLLRFEPRRPSAGAPAGGSGLGFNRPPRIGRPGPPDPLVLPAPPEAPMFHAPSPLALVLPLVFGVVMFLVIGSPFMLMFAALTPLMALSTYLDTRRRGGRTHRDSAAAFEAAHSDAAEQIDALRRTELEERRAAAPDPAALARRVEELEPTLWERRPGDDDFLELRVGTADRPSRVRVELEHGGDADARRRALEALDLERPLPNVPVAIPLAGSAAGIAAEPIRAEGLARWMTLQAAVLHSPAELRIGAVVPEDAAAGWRWLTWLPHVDDRHVVAGRAAGANLLEAAAEAAAAPGSPRRLIVVHGEAGLPPSALDRAVRAGVSVLWIARAPHEVPGGCRWLLVAPDEVTFRVTEAATGDTIDGITADCVDEEWSATLARGLAGVRDAGADDGRPPVPDRVSLLELLRLPRPDAATIAERWRAARPGVLSAPIGRTADGPFEIDAGTPEGLRMLVAGMPGAGKSELLQAMIAALAVRYPPTALTFLLVDYKGGSAFRACADLPHAVGLVTDLDARLADRARVSLLAELRRRETMLAEHGAKNLRELRRRHPEQAPPALVIVVDEFATLVRELPAFVDTVVDVAQRGRSLGLHLVLATQRPRGAVSDTLRASMNQRVAMRVSDAAESRDVIEAGDAASIPAGLPGRALALSGRRPDGSPHLIEFQAAYAGGRMSGLGAARRVTIRPLDGPREGQRHVLSTVGGSLPTDLQSIVTAARAAAEDLGLPAPRRPWLPPLPEILPFDESAGEHEPATARFGIIDEPEQQRRRPATLSLDDEGHLLVYGASGSGKTTLLRAIACSLAAGASPLELHLYALDFASRALRSLESLPHCGAVIDADDDERVLRLLGWLQRLVEERKRQAGTQGIAPGRPGVPRVVLLLDGYGAFTSAVERVDLGAPVRALARLAAEGRPLGIHVVVSADRRADVPGALAGVVPARVVLRMAAEDEYAALGAPRPAVRAELPPGRGFTAGGAELQVHWASPEHVAALGAVLAERHGEARAPGVGRLPERLSRIDLPAATAPLTATVGVDDERLQPAALDLAEANALVAGPHRSGLTTALATIASELREASPGLELHLLAPRRSALSALDVWTSAAEGMEACAAACARLPEPVSEPAVVIVDDAMELAEGAAAAGLEQLLRHTREARVRLVAAVDIHAAQRAYGGWVRDLRTERNGLLLQPNPQTDGELLGVRLVLRPGTPLPPGRGFLVTRGVPRLVQIAGD